MHDAIESRSGLGKRSYETRSKGVPEFTGQKHDSPFKGLGVKGIGQAVVRETRLSWPYDDYIFSPVIKQTIRDAKPADHGHITVYLPAHQRKCIEPILKAVSPLPVHWFLPEVTRSYQEDNITFFSIKQDDFNQSLINCHGLMTAGGFETPSEALYLNKKLLSIPIMDQYEQQCNAAALALLGIKVLKDLNEETKGDFYNWVTAPRVQIDMLANDIPRTIDYLLEKAG